MNFLRLPSRSYISINLLSLSAREFQLLSLQSSWDSKKNTLNRHHFPHFTTLPCILSSQGKNFHCSRLPAWASHFSKGLVGIIPYCCCGIAGSTHLITISFPESPFVNSSQTCGIGWLLGFNSSCCHVRGTYIPLLFTRQKIIDGLVGWWGQSNLF